MKLLEKLFHLSDARTTVRTEALAGLTTFMTMSYIIFVQPAILSTTGMDFQAVLAGTCIVSAIGCFLMAFLANYPIAVAPAMGHNFFFAFTVVAGMGYSLANRARRSVHIGHCVSYHVDLGCARSAHSGDPGFHGIISSPPSIAPIAFKLDIMGALKSRRNSGDLHIFLSRSVRQHRFSDRHRGTGRVHA